ncbi:hypothetical protein ACIP02_17845 [Pseudomonas sp. NPDC089408]|uniref:hypothetical protein n=1 Tax=Pseudomonas sp. NPDC089408 TaxID=3364465 RepID=UPI003804F1E5
MEPYKRTLYVSQLAAEIGSIGQAFEAFGGLVMNLVLKVPVGSQGINLRGFPVGGVVDGVSPDGLYAAEYSALQKYFDSSMGKARSDLRHVLAKAPYATEIYLLSSAVKATKIAQAFETDAMNWPEMNGRSLHLWGAVEIADAIIENALDNELAVRKLGHYLPSLSRFSEEEAAQALVPQPDTARIPRPEVDGLLDEIFAERNCVILAGLAGSGKSDAAAAYVHRNRQKYHTVLWLPGDNLKRIEDFQAVPIIRMGELRNVAGLLKNRCCLVVVDDASESLASDALSSLCGPGSHVLLIRRAVTTEAHVIPPMSQEDAQRLLTRNLSACPPRTWDMIWQAVGGHPLTISLLNAAVCEGATWADIEQDCRMPGTLESNGQILAERLLGRLRAASERGLALFEWAGTSQIDDKLIKTLATPAVVRTLRKYGLTAASRPGVIRLHDVVYASLSAQNWWTQADRDAITDKVCAYMGSAALDTDLAFWSAAINQRVKIQRLVEEGDRRPAFTYAMLSTWSPSDVRPELLADPRVDADLIAKGANLATPIATMALIETVEKLFLHDKLTSLRHAQQMLSQRIDVFDKLATAKGLTIKQQSEILHHKGKALVRLSVSLKPLAFSKAS